MAATLVIGACATADEEEDAEAPSIPVSTATPEPLADPVNFSFNLKTGMDVVGADSADLQLTDIIGDGRPVVINFYGATCPPCLMEMPIFQQAHAERGDSFLMLGVDLTDVAGFGTSEQAQELVEKTGVQYPLASVSHADLVVKYGFNKVPSTIFITGDGKLMRKIIGPVNEETFNGLIDELIGAS